MAIQETDPVYQDPEAGVGYIYILTNPSMPGMRKIGYTNRSVYKRIKELNTTGVPTSFRMERYFKVPDLLMHKIEQQAHSRLGTSRVKKGREFFRASAEQSLNAVTEAIRTVTGSEPFDCVEAYRIKVAKENAASQKRKADSESIALLRQEYIQAEMQTLEICQGPIKARDAQIESLQLAGAVLALWFLFAPSFWLGITVLCVGLIQTFLMNGHNSYDSRKSRIKRAAYEKYPHIGR